MKEMMINVKLESTFQSNLKKELKRMFPGCIIKRNSVDDIQGFPDITVYYGSKYAHLECKRTKHSPRRPNQQYYVDLFNDMGGYASFIYPENKDQVLAELGLWFNE